MPIEKNLPSIWRSWLLTKLLIFMIKRQSFRVNYTQIMRFLTCLVAFLAILSSLKERRPTQWCTCCHYNYSRRAPGTFEPIACFNLTVAEGCRAAYSQDTSKFIVLFRALEILSCLLRRRKAGRSQRHCMSESVHPCRCNADLHHHLTCES